MTREEKQQFTLRISQANSTELVVILYEMLLCCIKDAKEALAAGEETQMHEAVRRARGCLVELLNSLHMEYAPASELRELYLFCIRRLALSEYRRSAEMLGEVERVIRPLHEAYQTIASRNTGGTVMNNCQVVYAGLTYGRGALAEDVTDQSANRGMLI